jgi:type I restriction enzyme, S subunit
MNIPGLRFKEFEKPWEISLLGEILQERSDITNEDIPTYSLTIENGVTPKTDRYKREHLVADKDSAYKLVKKNDFAFNPMNLRFGAIGKHSEEQPVKVSKYYNIFYCNPSANHSFFEAYFRTSKMISFYDKMSTGSLAEKKRVHFSDFLKFKIPVPTYQEQTKIANFLTAVDEKITQLTQKTELLAQYKKGVMQQIFSQELRFKDYDGSEFPEWEETTLSTIAKIVGGGTPDTANEDYWRGNIQWFTPTELKTKYVSESKRTISVAGLKNSSAKVLPTGTLLLSSRATVGDVSIAINECTTNQGFQSLIVNDENNNEFVYYWLTNNKKALLEKASGSTFLEISKREIEKLGIQMPVKNEQTKIANFLTAIDDKITQTQAQLAAVKQYKQGLLQQMFV